MIICKGLFGMVSVFSRQPETHQNTTHARTHGTHGQSPNIYARFFRAKLRLRNGATQQALADLNHIVNANPEFCDYAAVFIRACLHHQQVGSLCVRVFNFFFFFFFFFACLLDFFFLFFLFERVGWEKGGEG